AQNVKPRSKHRTTTPNPPLASAQNKSLSMHLYDVVQSTTLASVFSTNQNLRPKLGFGGFGPCLLILFREFFSKSHHFAQMVLSNRRLKQKLRETLAQSLLESVAKTDPQTDGSENADPNSEPQSLKVLLDSATQKPRLSKREKRRKLLALRGSEAVSGSGTGGNFEENKGEEDKGEVESEDLGDEKEEKKKKKRKRDEEEKNGVLSSEENEVVKEEAKRPKKKNKKKKKKKNKKRKKEAKNEEEKKDGELGSEEQSVKETNNNSDGKRTGMFLQKVYVGGIPYYSTEDDIRSYFESCGTITEVDCLRFPDSGKFRGIAIISFKTEAAAKRALALDGAEMGELFLKIQPYKATRANKVSDFAHKLWRDCKISSIHFGMDKETGEFRGTPSNSAPTNSSTHSISVAPTTGANTIPVATTTDTGADNTELSTVSGKIKRRTCYQCGEKGHLSSACPMAATTFSSTHSIAVTTTTSADSIPVATTTDTGADDIGLSAVSGKIKRRTCYQCGEKGHLSSACPITATTFSSTHSIPIATTISTDSIPVATTTSTNLIPVATTTNTNSIPVATTTGADNGGLSAISGKIKRRTCYECGEKGHISSACPKKQSADNNASV
ncbi:phragmoplastin interacting protein 1, partial [Prunus dulcis]